MRGETVGCIAGASKLFFNSRIVDWLCYQYTYVISTHMLSVHICYQYTCYQYTHVISTHMLSIHICYQYTYVINTHMLSVHMCYQYTYVISTHMLSVHICYQYTYVISTHMHTAIPRLWHVWTATCFGTEMSSSGWHYNKGKVPIYDLWTRAFTTLHTCRTQVSGVYRDVYVSYNINSFFVNNIHI